jgi:hypothetical protein
MSKRYGVPYKGSKNAIAKKIVGLLPEGRRLVEPFAGGCAVTHCAMTMDRYPAYLVNDVDWRPVTLFRNALEGAYRDEDRWISREDFFRLKDSDPFVAACFSFGNNYKTYMYNAQLEPYKRAIHHIVFWNDFAPMEELCPAVCPDIHAALDGVEDRAQRRLKLGKAVAEHVKAHGSVEYWQSNPMFRSVTVKWTEARRGKSGDDLAGELQAAELDGHRSLESQQRLESLQSIEFDGHRSLESLERLQSLQSLERLQGLEGAGQQLEVNSKDYRELEYRYGDVVYCDPPYAGRDTYCSGDFDSAAFWEWARTREFPVYVSEYEAPEDFAEVFAVEKRVDLHTDHAGLAVEKVFLHRKFVNE